tara:strand:+ start:100 stop:534 length:435 start_codon:yes stop_codon:yes gene_type:complete
MSENKKPEYKENVDVLITHGEEALTFRKDDPRTQEYLDKKAEENLQLMKENGKDDLWYGISLSNARLKGESYENYKERLRTVKNLQKIYKTLGREECKRQFPNGFAYAIYQEVKDQVNKEQKPQFTATVDGKEVPVEINNDKNK